LPKHMLTKIENRMPEFSKGQKKIGEFILRHYDKAAFMTAGKLGSTVGVSESTVVRFAMALGYEGYPEFQQVLQELIRNRLTSTQRMEVGQTQLGNEEVLEKVLRRDIDKIEKTLALTDQNEFYAAVEAISAARNIYVLGVRSSAPLAEFLGFYLNLMYDNVKVVHASTSSEVFEKTFRVTEGDVFIAISFPRYSKQTFRMAGFASDRGADVVAITDSAASPLAGVATYKLLAASDMLSFIDSLTAPLSLINALLVALGMRRTKELSETFSELERVWEEYQIYEKTE